MLTDPPAIVFTFAVTLKHGPRYWITVFCRDRSEVLFLKRIYAEDFRECRIRKTRIVYPSDQVWTVDFKRHSKKRWPSRRRKVMLRARMIFTSEYSARCVTSLWESLGMRRKESINPFYSVVTEPNQAPF